MKKTNFITGSFLVLFTVLLISCSGGSVKGNWSDADKEKFNNVMKEVGVEDQALIDCYLSKCEATYSSFSEADSKEDENSTIVEECMDEIFANGSVLGNWSDADKESFRADMLGEGLSAEFTECYLSKCEAAFKSYFHADNDESGRITEVAGECAHLIAGEEATE